MRGIPLVLALAGCGGGGSPGRGDADASPDTGPHDAAPAEDAAPADAGPEDAGPIEDAGGCPSEPIDVVYVVDTSPDMAAARASLVERLPATLDALRAGWGKHTLEVGVLSQDLGTGDAECAPDGDGAILQSDVAPDVAGCDASYPAFLADPVDAADLACIGALEADGCGVQRPGDAVLRGLRGANPGFPRSGSTLVVVVLSATEDCSTDDEASLSGGGAMRCYDAERALTSPGALADRWTTIRRPASFFAVFLGGFPEYLGGCEAGDFDCVLALPEMTPVDEAGVPRAICDSPTALARPTPRIGSLAKNLDTLAPGHVALASICDDNWTASFVSIGAEIGTTLCVD